MKGQAMQITCTNCGSDRFKAGDVNLSPRGGYEVVMPCSDCHTPNMVLHSDDVELCEALLKFFAA
jgi:hypothetical protein